MYIYGRTGQSGSETCSACGFSAAGGIYYERGRTAVIPDIPMIIFRSYHSILNGSMNLWRWMVISMSPNCPVEMLANGEIDHSFGGMAYNDALAEI